MPTQSFLESAQDLALLLGPREADIMRLLWTRGPATVREIHTDLTTNTLLAYTTIMTTCVRLWEKGLLERRSITKADQRKYAWRAYLYAPCQSEADFVRTAIERRIEPVLAQYPALVQAQISGVPKRKTLGVGSSDRARVEHILAYLGTLCDPYDQPIDDTVLDTIAALLERAETAERAMETTEAEHGRAQVRANAAEQRAEAAERRAGIAERQLATALRQMNRPPQPERRVYVHADTIHEYRDVAGICRVCGRPAPPQSAARRDDLRVCREERCRTEAQRRDNNVKQRRYKERRLGRRQNDLAQDSAIPSL